jgi:hypothetical protein
VRGIFSQPFAPKLWAFPFAHTTKAVLCWCCISKGLANPHASESEEAKFPNYGNISLLITTGKYFSATK